ncbi:MAG: FixH family protein [Hydrogenophilus sp.]|nr:FixH family protein [Hydrogenophilus sp.]
MRSEERGGEEWGLERGREGEGRLEGGQSVRGREEGEERLREVSGRRRRGGEGRVGEREEPWYRQRWPWLLMMPPLAAVVGGMATLVVAVRSWDGLVVDDYYREGLAIQQQIERTERAATLGLVARVRLADERVVIGFEPSSLRIDLPPVVVVRFIHPTMTGYDRQLYLVRDGDRYWAPLVLPMAGRWRVEIEDEHRQWRLSGMIQVPTEQETQIIAPRVPDRS